jgi:hypothetical protein
MAIPDDVSHGDIYHKLGSLEGKLEAVLISLGERRDDISGIFTRLRQVEHRMAWAMGAAVIISFAAPLVINAMQPRLHLTSPSHQAR